MVITPVFSSSRDSERKGEPDRVVGSKGEDDCRDEGGSGRVVGGVGEDFDDGKIELKNCFRAIVIAHSFLCVRGELTGGVSTLAVEHGAPSGEDETRPDTP